ncbi:MAG: 50S ribosomal protein L10 [Candidatus Roizmanbacteria bacterium GW2011_GWA2_36_23]|uniref:Large ribosomal subunit protein uL10 n=1 Tax=Candidatus Roizmanbacteria bacterium GW2011_GWA2_36_23 TaxID=1618480 RepID=A0A0G0E4G3_9BACT|nr:MAG: 50S ribosomal protein L10 [Candidatus Roizmanbacteria bacterium GW2011_GWA2_36_23]
MANQIKKIQIDQLLNILQGSENFLLIKFGKTSHQTLENLRNELKKNGSKLSVLKNTLFEKAINKLSITNNALNNFKKHLVPLNESNALLTFKTDWNKALKSLHAFMQKEKSLTYRSAILDNQVYKDKEIEKIAQLPGKDELIAKVIGCIKNPVGKLVYSMKFNTNKLVYILKQKSNKN